MTKSTIDKRWEEIESGYREAWPYRYSIVNTDTILSFFKSKFSQQEEEIKGEKADLEWGDIKTKHKDGWIIYYCSDCNTKLVQSKDGHILTLDQPIICCGKRRA